MTQTGTAWARAIKVFRARVDSLWTKANGKLWWPEDEGFTAPPMTDPPSAPAAILRVQPNRSFEDPLTWGGGNTSGQGSISFVFGVQARPGMLTAIGAAETDIRAIADPSQNDDAEDIWTMGDVEVNPDVAPRGIPEALSRAFNWTQFVVPYRLAEGFI